MFAGLKWTLRSSTDVGSMFDRPFVSQGWVHKCGQRTARRKRVQGGSRFVAR
jgi:hypothetical protein